MLTLLACSHLQISTAVAHTISSLRRAIRICFRTARRPRRRPDSRHRIRRDRNSPPRSCSFLHTFVSRCTAALSLPVTAPPTGAPAYKTSARRISSDSFPTDSGSPSSTGCQLHRPPTNRLSPAGQTRYRQSRSAKPPSPTHAHRFGNSRNSTRQTSFSAHPRPPPARLQRCPDQSPLPQCRCTFRSGPK